MGIIAKGYTTAIIDSATVLVCDINAAFDRIYDLVNGGLDSANFLSSQTFPASQVSFTDSNANISASLVSDIQGQLALKGWNSIHVMGLGTGGLDVFPGVIEVNGQYCRLNSRIHYSARDNMRILNSSSQVCWMVLAPQVPVYTASDFSFVSYDSTNTINFNIQKNGFYYCETKRLICTIRMKETASSIYFCENDEFFQRPSIGHRYLMANSEAYFAGFNSLTDGVLTTNSLVGWTSVYHLFDMDTNRYFYEVHGHANSATGTAMTIWRGTDVSSGPTVTTIGPSQSFHHHWYVDHATIQDSNSVTQNINPTDAIDEVFGPIGKISIQPNPVGLNLTTVAAKFNRGQFFIRVKRRDDSFRRFL